MYSKYTKNTVPTHNTVLTEVRMNEVKKWWFTIELLETKICVIKVWLKNMSPGCVCMCVVVVYI